ncbi:hypothetical protein [Sedimenticola sp.]|uniref:hypothetical protein n=1 Tax=Sedimenticola sp. TaxID=1940285 RepID=UPI003D0D953E
MGMLDKWFGSKHAYPPLEAGSDAQHYLDDISDELKGLARQVRGPLEVIPSDHEAFVFIGKPPQQFGIAWIHDGEVTSFQKLVEEWHLSNEQRKAFIHELQDAYEHAEGVRRYSARIGGRKITVTPSPLLERAVHEVFDHMH